MIRILHVLDASCDESLIQVLEMLRARGGGDRADHVICSIDGPAARRARQFVGARVHRVESRVLRSLGWSPGLTTLARRFEPTILHAWGIEAARGCAAALPDRPRVVSILDPTRSRPVARWGGAVPNLQAIATGSQVIRAQLLTHGMPAPRVVVIRGAVDFGAISASRQRTLDGGSTTQGQTDHVAPVSLDTLVPRVSNRQPNGAAPREPVVLLPGPATRESGHFYGLWAVTIAKHAGCDLSVLMPYPSRESNRMRRFLNSIRMSSLLARPSADRTWPALVAQADVFLIPAVGEIPTEPIAWAMAAGLPVVGSAVRSVAELIADRSNGLLCKPAQPRALAQKLLTVLEDHDLRARVTETARGQAYEVFGMRRFTDDYHRLYENVLERRDAGDGIRDSAMVA